MWVNMSHDTFVSEEICLTLVCRKINLKGTNSIKNKIKGNVVQLTALDLSPFQDA